MGLLLDSSIIISAERRRDPVVALLRQVAAVAGDQPVTLSAIGLTEIVHALYRTSSPEILFRRQSFLDNLLAELEIIPYTKATAFLAGKIDGQQRAQGITIPSTDLFIGATALEHGYALMTVNVRDFALIPGLKIVTL